MAEKLVRRVLKIKGMTCTSCEMRIEDKLKKIEGIKKAKAIYSGSELYITYDADVIGLDRIVEAIEELDYMVITKSGNKLPLNQLLGIGIIILAAYVIIKNTIGFNFIPRINQNMGYGILFLVGLFTSLHCIAMCGGINLSQCVSYKFREGEEARLKKLKPSLLYNGGRVISYTLIGGIVGAMGSVVSFSGAAKGVVAIVSGVLMVIMGLNMLNIFPWLKKLNPHMPKVFGKRIHSSSGKNGPFYVGLLNGLMPCGPLQAMQIYALGTGGFVEGAASMFFFSIGTVPLMFGFGAATTIVSRKFNHEIIKVSAILVIILGVLMAGRGFNLSGVNIALASPNTGNVAKIENGVQIVTTELELGRYTPIVVQKGIPVKWTIKADESELNGCNNPVTVPKYNIQKRLVPGDNTIEFTPQEEGNITYTCWMGMISSTIKVVNNINDENVKNIEQGEQNSVPNGGGCCGGRT